jgi:hypothetical protein
VRVTVGEELWDWSGKGSRIGDAYVLEGISMPEENGKSESEDADSEEKLRSEYPRGQHILGTSGEQCWEGEELLSSGTITSRIAFEVFAHTSRLTALRGVLNYE